MARKYSKSSQKDVKKEMKRLKKGTAHSGPKHKKVKSRKQAIAIGLSKARKKGKKAPSATSKKSATSRKSTKKKTSSSRSVSRRSAAKKSASRR